ncbi:hypothetical protein JCM14124_28230 [Humidesulfovibrio idahonensis]
MGATRAKGKYIKGRSPLDPARGYAPPGPANGAKCLGLMHCRACSPYEGDRGESFPPAEGAGGGASRLGYASITPRCGAGQNRQGFGRKKDKNGGLTGDGKTGANPL